MKKALTVGGNCAEFLLWRQNSAHQSIAGFVILLTSFMLASRILVPALDFWASSPEILLASIRLVSRITNPAIL